MSDATEKRESPLGQYVLNCARLARECCERGEWDRMVEHLDAATAAMREANGKNEG